MVLDTNAYSALAKGNTQLVELIGKQAQLSLPLPVIAELRFGFAKGTRRDHDEAVLRRFMAQPQVTIVLPVLTTTQHYAQLQLHCVNQGRALSHNDLWIAALAQERDEPLVTFDQDFTVLSAVMGDGLIILRP